MLAPSYETCSSTRNDLFERSTLDLARDYSHSTACLIYPASPLQMLRAVFCLYDEMQRVFQAFFADVATFCRLSADVCLPTYGLNGFFSSMINSMKKSRFLIVSASTCLLDGVVYVMETLYVD
jgi:hypothetical protein